MKKILIAIVLIFINLFLGYYLFTLQGNKKELNIELLSDQLIYQINDIELNNLSDFIFSNYFVVTSNTNSYKYSFNDKYINVQIGQNSYSFEYTINEPKVIEKTVYKEVAVDNSNKEIETKEEDEIEYETNEYFYVNSDYLCFDYGTSLDEIRNEIINNINTTHETSIDYKDLNTSSIGQYSVVYTANDKKIEIIVEIT